jgi:hypothetical protein
MEGVSFWQATGYAVKTAERKEYLHGIFIRSRRTGTNESTDYSPTHFDVFTKQASCVLYIDHNGHVIAGMYQKRQTSLPCG